MKMNKSGSDSTNLISFLQAMDKDIIKYFQVMKDVKLSCNL